MYSRAGLADYTDTPLPVNTEFGLYDGAALDPGGADELPDPPYLRGLGGSQKTGGIIATAGSIGGSIAGALLAGTAAAGPVGLAIAGVGILLTTIFGGRSGAQKVASTHIVDDVEPILRQNLEAYLASDRTVSDQAAAVQNFDYAWAGVVKACGDPQLGDAGKNCVNDRKRGSTKGYDWFALYRDPIANDTPNPDPTLTSAAGDLVGGVGSAFSSLPGWAPWVLAGLVGLWVFSGVSE